MNPTLSFSSTQSHRSRWTQQLPPDHEPASTRQVRYPIREDLFPRTPEGYIILPCPSCLGIPPAANCLCFATPSVPSSSTAPQETRRRGAKRELTAPDRGVTHQRRLVAPPPKKVQQVRQPRRRRPKPVRERKWPGRPGKMLPGMGHMIFERNHSTDEEEALDLVQH